MAELSYNVDTTELEDEDLPDVIDEIGELSGRYENIATCLRVKANAVDRIKSEHLNSDTALKEVVREWLKKNYNAKKAPGPPSWKTLVEAVAKPAGGNDRALAEKIANKHQAGGIPAVNPIQTHAPPSMTQRQLSQGFKDIELQPKDPNWFTDTDSGKSTCQTDGGGPSGKKLPFECYQPYKTPPGKQVPVKFSFGGVVPIADQQKNDVVGAYKMEKFPHGIALIINNEKFKKQSNRVGTSIDEKNLVNAFKYLGYIVDVHRDCTSDKILEVMGDMQRRDHSQYDSFVCCILSHGKAGQIFGTDSVMVSLDDVTTKFNGQQCPSLARKPKLFFLQACRGVMKDKGVNVDADGDEEEGEQQVRSDAGVRVANDGDMKIPDASDFYFGYATPLGHVAWRDLDNGSWYVSELCKCLAGYSRYLSLNNIMTITNRRVSTVYDNDVYKQSPESTTRLTNDVFFF